MSALTAGYNAALQELRSPGTTASAQTITQLSNDYDRAWAYYRNNGAAVYSDAYITRLALYRYTRLLFNPVPTVVGFYEDHLFPSVPRIIQDNKKRQWQLVTPVMDDVDDELKFAIAQIDQWSNWLSESHKMVRYCAVTGSVLVEIDEDFEGEKIGHRIWWPSKVKDPVLDGAGNVKAYTLEYKAMDADGTQYTFRKESDGETFRYFRDDRPFDPPNRPAGDDTRIEAGVYVNPYGFVPAVWIKHIDDGDIRGLPAFWNIEKVDEINSLASHANDHVHKAIEAGKVISTDGTIMSVTGAVGSSAANTSGGIAPYDTRSDWMLLKAPQGASVHDLGSSFDVSKADREIDRLRESLDEDYPERQAKEILKNKSQLSTATMERLLAPSQSKLNLAFNGYGQQIIKLKQMSVAVGGMRANGGWKKGGAQRDVFKPFSLKSYAAGDLNFGLKPSLLVQSTPMEEKDYRAKQVEIAKGLEGIVDKRTQLIEAGYSEDRADEIIIALGKKPDEQEGATT